MITEALCSRCGETFIPTGEEDTRVIDGELCFEHYVTAAGDECGGFGPIIGSWGRGR